MVWTTLEIWSIPTVIWVMASACSLEALAMASIISVASWIPVTTFSKAPAVSSAILLPFSTEEREFSIRTAVFLDASADLLARSRTSSATTAKPLPALPALAASTAALRARMLVWNAISSMVLMIFPISPEELLISAMAVSISCILRFPSAAISLTVSDFLLASSAPRAFSLMRLEISSMDAASSSTEEACSVAP